jgi:small subunit ribosomal protein S8e
MPIIQGRSKRKPSGGRYKAILFKKRKAQKGHAATSTKLGEKRTQQVRMRGGKVKTRLLLTNKISVYDPKTKKHSVETIKTIVGNPANEQFVRRNIMTKGALVETSKGKVKITSRPGQEGILSGILVE